MKYSSAGTKSVPIIYKFFIPSELQLVFQSSFHWNLENNENKISSINGTTMLSNICLNKTEPLCATKSKF